MKCHHFPLTTYGIQSIMITVRVKFSLACAGCIHLVHTIAAAPSWDAAACGLDEGLRGRLLHDV